MEVKGLIRRTRRPIKPVRLASNVIEYKMANLAKLMREDQQKQSWMAEILIVSMSPNNGQHIAESFHNPNTDSNFGFGDAIHLDWSEVPNTLTMEDLRHIFSFDIHIRGSDGAHVVAPDGNISAHLHNYEYFNNTQNDDILPSPWLQAAQHCSYNQECF